MNVWQIIGLVTFLGMIGGLTNCLITGGFTHPSQDSQHKVWRPGWIANILVGAVAGFSFCQ